MKSFKFNVPLVNVVVRVEPTVKLSNRLTVPPTPETVTGKSNVFPLLLMF